MKDRQESRGGSLFSNSIDGLSQVLPNDKPGRGPPEDITNHHSGPIQPHAIEIIEESKTLPTLRTAAVDSSAGGSVAYESFESSSSISATSASRISHSPTAPPLIHTATESQNDKSQGDLVATKSVTDGLISNFADGQCSMAGTARHDTFSGLPQEIRDSIFYRLYQSDPVCAFWLPRNSSRSHQGLMEGVYNLIRLKAALPRMFFAFRPREIPLTNNSQPKYEGELTWLNQDADRSIHRVDVIDLKGIREIHIDISKEWAWLDKPYKTKMAISQMELLFDNLALLASESGPTVTIWLCPETDFERFHNEIRDVEAVYGTSWKLTRTMRDLEKKWSQVRDSVRESEKDVAQRFKISRTGIPSDILDSIIASLNL